jgi:hypothetical protein
MMIVDLNAPQVILEEYFSSVDTCLSLLRSTRALLRGGGLVKYFSGKENYVGTLCVYCSESAVRNWKIFVKGQGYKPLTWMDDQWVRLWAPFL